MEGSIVAYFVCGNWRLAFRIWHLAEFEVNIFGDLGNSISNLGEAS
jgi:hypothetical protein